MLALISVDNDGYNTLLKFQEFKFVIPLRLQKFYFKFIFVIFIMQSKKGKGKGKMIPLQARCGLEGGYSYSSTLP